ncbi:FeoB-associated Cys-rich membrane protein [Faecalicatena contorta]|nr:FeoB-associated Cys-rich membrane protein [Faecalicatena contorta]MCF2682628.1 FeoB-associated Cys-rich membrane protein [Faecalicatena contorta]
MGTFIMSLLLAGAVVMAVRNLIKRKKDGKSLQCGGDCANCSRDCH